MKSGAVILIPDLMFKFQSHSNLKAMLRVSLPALN